MGPTIIPKEKKIPKNFPSRSNENSLFYKMKFFTFNVPELMPNCQYIFFLIKSDENKKFGKKIPSRSNKNSDFFKILFLLHLKTSEPRGLLARFTHVWLFF